MTLPSPRRRFGQNFLVDRSVAEWIAARATAIPDAPFVEIGPGRGALTGWLLDSGRPLVAIELDRDLAAHLRAKRGDSPRFRIVEADAVSVDWEREIPAWFPGTSPVVVGNLPYNVATPIARALLDRISLFPRLVLMFQREVAERLEATEGEGYGYLSVESWSAATVVDRLDVPPGAFHPRPKVDSSVLVLEPAADRPTIDERRRLLDVASAGFLHRRKRLASNLASAGWDRADVGEAFSSLRLEPGTRVEQLSPPRLLDLARRLPRRRGEEPVPSP